MRNINKIIQEAKEHFIVNQEQTFVILKGNNQYMYCNLKTLNWLVNGNAQDIKVIGSWDAAITTFDANKKAHKLGCKYYPIEA